LASHQPINSSRQKPESARNTIRTCGQRCRSWATMRLTSSTASAASVLVGRPQTGAQQLVAGEDIQRQIAVAAVVAMEEALRLMAV